MNFVVYYFLGIESIVLRDGTAWYEISFENVLTATNFRKLVKLAFIF